MNSAIKTLLMVENVHQSEFFEKILNNNVILNKTNDFYKALELLDVEHFDILLLNLDLKDQENINFLKKLRAQHPDVPLLIIVNYYDEEIPLKAFEFGAHDYLIRVNSLLKH